jgi:LysM repeat protein
VPEPTPNAALRAALPWFAAAAVVLAVAVTAGFVTAYLVASGRAVDAPGIAAGSPTPRPTISATLPAGETAQPSIEPTIQPRRTPTPPPIVTPEPTPFEHVVQRGEFLSYIANLYCTTVAAIIELNDIANPNRIQVGQVLLIPGGGCPQPTPK